MFIKFKDLLLAVINIEAAIYLVIFYKTYNKWDHLKKYFLNKGINNSGELPLSASGVNFTPLLYANGPGGLKKIRTKNLTNSDTSNFEKKKSN